MSLNEMMPIVNGLTRIEKIQLIQMVAHQLEVDEHHPELVLIKAGESYPVWSPFNEYEAAAKMSEALEAVKARP